MGLRATVRLAPGSGHVARRGDAVLYLPERDDRLLDAFMTSPDGGELQAVASAAVAAGFDVTPFVSVRWAPTVQVMAFGAVEVETDQPSLPMLSGAGSRTWVEHSLTVDTSARIESGDGNVDTATDLASGVALAGGFRLELATPTESAPSVEAVPPAVEPAPSPIAPDRDVTQAVLRPPEPAGPDAAPAPLPPVDADDPAAALAAIQAAAMAADGRPVFDAETPVDSGPESSLNHEADEPVDADITLPPPPPSELLAEVHELRGDDIDRSRESLVDAKVCPDGHPNPPVVASCAVCGQLLTPGAAAIVHVPRPSLGHLDFDDGSIVELDHELLIGRNPDRDNQPERSGLRRVKVLGDKVSRSHLELRYQGWDILVIDCGSTNGTFVVPHPGGQVTALEAGRPQLLEPGATVYFGSRSFTVVGREAG